MRSSSEHKTSPDSPGLRRRRSESNWGGPRLALIALVAAAVALRAVGLLPFDHLLAPNERDVVPRSWRLVHGGGGDPHWFRYPSLLLYSLAPVEAWQRAPSYLAARIVVVAAAAAAVGVTWWVARRLYGSFLSGAVGAAVVAVATTHVAYSHAALPDVPLSLAVVAALGLAASRRSDLAAIASGAAAGLDYAGLLLAVPLVVASWRRWWQLARALALMLVTFVATTPLLVVHLGRAWSDATAERGDALPFGGHVAAVDRLWHTLGPALFVAAAGVVVALVRRRREELVVVSFVLAFAVALLVADAQAPRTILPLVPPLAVLAARFRSLAAVTLLLLVVPLTWSVRDDSKLVAGASPVATAAASGTSDRRRPSTARPPRTPAPRPPRARDAGGFPRFRPA
jgi:hypothetical protein